MGLDDVQQPINEQLSDQPEKNFDPVHEDIKRHNDEILKTKLLKVQFPLSSKAIADIDKLSSTFYDLGKSHEDKQKVKNTCLAANQLGLTTNAIIVLLNQPTLMINPEIIGHSKTKKTKTELCFTIPAVSVRVPRWKEISVQFQDENGIEHTIFINNPKFARRVQHGIDHLNGILFSDYTTKDNPPILTDKIGEA